MVRHSPRGPEYRPLTERERAVLDGLLQFDHPGVESLREHATTAQVRRSCTCGCPSIGFQRGDAKDSQAFPSVWPASAWSEPLRLEIILFVEDGRLAEMELVTFDGPTPSEWPDAGEFVFDAGTWPT